MLTSEVMFELGLRRAQSFDLLTGEGKKKGKKMDFKKLFSRKKKAEHFY